MKPSPSEARRTCPGNREVTLHFLAKAGKASELTDWLQSLGFEALKTLPGGQRVLLTATAGDVHSRLGVELALEVREERVGPSAQTRTFPVIPGDVELSAHLAALVERVYTARPPDRYLAR